MADAETRPQCTRPGCGRAVVDRLPNMGAAICAGLLLCVSFPPFGWWYTAIVAFAVLGWVLLRESTTPVGGFGYGFLFGLVFYIPLLPWTGELVGRFPVAGAVRDVCVVSRAVRCCGGRRQATGRLARSGSPRCGSLRNG